MGVQCSIPSKDTARRSVQELPPRGEQALWDLRGLHSSLKIFLSYLEGRDRWVDVHAQTHTHRMLVRRLMPRHAHNSQCWQAKAQDEGLSPGLPRGW